MKSVLSSEPVQDDIAGGNCFYYRRIIRTFEYLYISYAILFTPAVLPYGLHEAERPHKMWWMGEGT